MDSCGDSDDEAFFVNMHLAAAVASEQGQSRGPVREGCRAPGSFERVLAAYGPLFHRAVRMSKPCFLNLVDTLRPRLSTSPHALSPTLLVFLALRYYAGGSYLDVCAVSGVSSSAFYEAVWTFTDAVLDTPDLQMSMPVWDQAWRQRTTAGFQRRSDSPLNNVIGALDGIVVRQERPTAAEVACPKDYWSRKGFFALNVQAICDSNYEFLWMSCKAPGSSHDSSALACSDLGQQLRAPCSPLVALMIREGLCITADEAYRDSEVMAVPWAGGGGGDQWRDAYNFYQSSARIHIEQAFGQLVWRWGILWKPLRMPFAKRPMVIHVAFLLHNLCRRTDAATLSLLDGTPAAHRAMHVEQGQGASRQHNLRQRGIGSELRRRMTKEVEDSGRVRPFVPLL